MGKDLKGKELGKGISQRKDGRYQARFTDRFGKRRCVYGITLKEVKNATGREALKGYTINVNMAYKNYVYKPAADTECVIRCEFYKKRG